MPITRGDSREHRPDLNHGRLALMVAQQAGMPLLRPPRRGKSREVHACGQVLQAPLAPVQTTDGLTDLVADRALSSADNRQPCAATKRTGITRVPATLQAAQPALAQVDPPDRAPLLAGYRSRVWSAHDGGVAQRGVLIASEPRQAPAQRTGDTPLLTHRAQAVHAFTTLGRLTLACAAEARQALATLGRG
jgi:transposase